jgi:glycosyltransferase involved in cell wall biosynthesis
MEAAACGRPIICGDLDGSRDAVLNGKLGTLLDPLNVNLIQKTIREILRNKNSINEVMTIQQRCIQHFNYTRYQQKVKQLLNNPKSEIHK